ncbi:LacI family DNA-binding transcriptional regulator [Paracoccaceae bacterium GXU_MW_L88]
MNLKELSERLGLSQTTVSRALNGYPEVGAKTRARVEEAAKKFGYTPSTAATMLATGKTRVIGHIINTTRHDAIDPHFADFLAGASARYAALGYDMMLTIAQEGEEEQVVRRLKRRGLVDGVVVQVTRHEDPRVGILDELDMPYVFHGRTASETEPTNWMDIDNHGAFRTATNYLIDKGHKRIGLLNGPAHLGFSIFRERGYREALEGAGLPVDEALIHRTDMNEHNGHRLTRALMDGAAPPTALLCSSTLLAVGARRALRSAEGRAVEIVCHDDCLSFADMNYGDRRLTVTRSSIRDAGGKVAEMIVDLVEGKAEAPYRELWDAPLVEATPYRS